MAALAAMLGTLLPRAAKGAPSHGGERNFEIAFGLYASFDMLDVSEPAEVFVGLPNVKLRSASPDGGAVKSFYGISVTPTERLADVKSADMICIPGEATHAVMLTRSCCKGGSLHQQQWRRDGGH
jgi:transcriptional regulator GlxA family with amidase domain